MLLSMWACLTDLQDPMKRPSEHILTMSEARARASGTVDLGSPAGKLSRSLLDRAIAQTTSLSPPPSTHRPPLAPDAGSPAFLDPAAHSPSRRLFREAQALLSKTDVLSAPAPTPQKGLVLFDIAKFKGLLSNFMTKHASSWVYAVHFQNNPIGAAWNGLVQMPPDLKGDVLSALLLPDTRMDTASCSKTITAIAMIRLLGQVGRSLDDPIGPELSKIPLYLLNPKDPDLYKITYRMLLRHFSGIPGTVTTANGQQAMFDAIAALPDIKPNGGYDYANVNYALCRYLAFYLLGNPDPNHAGHLYNQAGPAFCAYIRRQIFGPIGINNVTWGPSGQFPLPPLAYPFPATWMIKGMGPGILTNGEREAGPGWILLSVNEYLTLLDSLWAGKILTQPQLSDFMGNSAWGLGCLRNVVKHPNKSNIAFYYHNGDAYYDAVEPAKFWARYRWVSAPAFKFSVAVASNCCDLLEENTIDVSHKIQDFFVASLTWVL